MKILITTTLVTAVTLTACTPAGDTGQETTLASNVHLQHVIDGDTLTVRWARTTHKVRILGIDAPEIPHPSYGKPTGEPCGQEATALIRKFVTGHRLTHTTDYGGDATDKYGRPLAYVEANGHDVGAELLKVGPAEQYHAARGIDRYKHYVQLEVDAPSLSCSTAE